MSSEEKKKSRTFGWGLVGLFAILGIIRWFLRGEEGIPWQFYVAVIGLALNLAVPITLYPIYKGAMFIAHYLGWFNTRLILGLIYFLVFTPMALIFRITGKELLDRKFDKKAKSYWNMRARVPFDASRVENQF